MNYNESMPRIEIVLYRPTEVEVLAARRIGKVLEAKVWEAWSVLSGRARFCQASTYLLRWRCSLTGGTVLLETSWTWVRLSLWR